MPIEPSKPLSTGKHKTLNSDIIPKISLPKIDTDRTNLGEYNGIGVE